MVSFNSNEFERNLRKATEEAANDAMKKTAAQLQHVLDGVHRTHAGKPLQDVKPVLNAACRRVDFTLNDEQLVSWATAISEGTRIVVKPEHVRL